MIMRRLPTRFELRGGVLKEPSPVEMSEDDSFELFKSGIKNAMRAGKTHYNDLTNTVTPAVEDRLRAEFGSKWTFQFNVMRRGCTIFWS